jgi:hypothetical protein
MPGRQPGIFSHSSAVLAPLRSPVRCTAGQVAFPCKNRKREVVPMIDEKIKVRVTDTGQVLDVVVLNKRAERIQIVLGEGIHSVKCDLSPTRNGMGYAGSAMGRELIYERSRDQVQADIDRLNPALRKSR